MTNVLGEKHGIGTELCMSFIRQKRGYSKGNLQIVMHQVKKFIIDQLCLVRSDHDFAEIICFVVLGGGAEFGGGGE